MTGNVSQPVPVRSLLEGPLSRCREPAPAMERFKRGLEIFELAVKVTVAIELGFLLRSSSLPVPLRSLLSSSLFRPSLGHWVSYHCLAGEILRSHGWPAYSDWIERLEDRYHLVAIRNKFAHGLADSMLHDPDVATAMNAVTSEIDEASLFTDGMFSLGEPVEDFDGLAISLCTFEFANSIGIEVSPLIAAIRSSGDRADLLLFQSCDTRISSGRPVYSSISGRGPMRPPAVGRIFARVFPLARWERPLIAPLGFAETASTEIVGRDVERTEFTKFLRTGTGSILITGAPGLGKTGLVQAILGDLQGSRTDTPLLEEVESEPITIAYFIRRGTDSANPTRYLNELMDTLTTVFKLPSMPPARSDLDRFVQLQLAFAQIETEMDSPALALLIDGLDEGTWISAFIPPGGQRVRVLLTARQFDETYSRQPWTASLKSEHKLVGIGAEHCRQMLVSAGAAGALSQPNDLIDGSSGNPLYLRLALAAPPTRKERPKTLVELIDLLLSNLTEQSPISGNVLRTLAEFEEALPIHAIAELAKLTPSTVSAILAGPAAMFVAIDPDAPQCWSLIHDLVRARLRASHLGHSILRRLLQLSVDENSYRSKLAPFLVRRGVSDIVAESLFDGKSERSSVNSRKALVELFRRHSHLRFRLSCQTVYEFLRDVGEVAAALSNSELEVFTESIANFVASTCADQTVAILPEHLQDAYLAGNFAHLIEPLLGRLTDIETIRAEVRDPELAALITVGFQYGKASILRRTCEPRNVEQARFLLTKAAGSVGSSNRLAIRSAREMARIQYDLGYIAYLQGKPREAVTAFRSSAEAAQHGGDEVGVWIARCLEVHVAFSDRSLPGWVADAAIDRAVKSFARAPFGSPHASRWVYNARSQGFDYAFRDRDLDRAKEWFNELQEDVVSRRSSPLSRPNTTLAQMKMLERDWSSALEILQPIVAKLIDKGTVRAKEGAARELVELGVVHWQLGGYNDAVEAWRLADNAPLAAGNWPWQRQARELLAGEQRDVWPW